jgi:hypothetical protein
MDQELNESLTAYVARQRERINGLRERRFPRLLTIGITIGCIGMLAPFVLLRFVITHAGDRLVVFCGAIFLLSAVFTTIVLGYLAVYRIECVVLRRAEQRLAHTGIE